MSCFGFSHSHKKTTGDLNIFLPFTGMISYQWLDFQPVVQNLNWLLPIVLKVENALKLFFVISMPSGLHRNTVEEHWSKNLEFYVFLVWFHTGGWISNQWFKIIKWLIPIILKVENALKLFFLTYLCHQDYIETLGSEFKGFWNVVNLGPIWTWNHCAVVASSSQLASLGSFCLPIVTFPNALNLIF